MVDSGAAGVPGDAFPAGRGQQFEIDFSDLRESTYYVRVLPMAGEQPIGAVSPWVVVHRGTAPRKTLSVSSSRAKLRRVPDLQMQAVGRTKLSMCGHAGECREGLGWVEGEHLVPLADKDKVRQFVWTTTHPQATGGLWQVSTEMFGSIFVMDPTGLIGSGAAGRAVNDSYLPNGQSFTIDFSGPWSLTGPGTTPPAASAARRVPNLILKPSTDATGAGGVAEIPRTYYVRVIPMAGDKPLRNASKTLVVNIGTPQQQENPLAIMPDLFELQIVSFEPVRPPTLHWGCMYIKSVDRQAVIDSVPDLTGLAGPALADIYQQAAASGVAVCPKGWRGRGSPAWYESFWDFATNAVSWVAERFEDAKNACVSLAAGLINEAVPGLCNPDCETGLRAGLTAGLVALGIPPEIPNLNEMMDDGLGYLVEVAAAEAGIDCDATCRDAIKQGLQGMAAEVSRQNRDRLCSDAEWAHDHGVEPLCLPPGVVGEIAPETEWRLAAVVVRVTRKPDAAAAAGANAPIPADPRARLEMTFSGYNDSLVGQMVSFPSAICTGDKYVTRESECGYFNVEIEEPLFGDLFDPIRIDLPVLTPGQSVEFPVNLRPAYYEVPEYDRLGYIRIYDDWNKLYDGGRLTLRATVRCAADRPGALEPCKSVTQEQSHQLPDEQFLSNVGRGLARRSSGGC